jgi:hypothetical protein
MALLAIVGRIAAASLDGPALLCLVPLGASALSFGLAAALGGTRWIDAWRLPLVLLVLSQLWSVHLRIGGDGYEYYAVARSLLFDRDLDLTNDFAGLSARPILLDGGRAISRMPLGMSLVWMVPLGLAHLGLLVGRIFGVGVAANGFSEPYQAACTLTSFVGGALAVLVTEALVRRFFGRPIALLTALALWAGTPLAFYSVANPFMSHACSALAVALFVAAWLRGRDREGVGPWLGMGVLGGLMALIRIQDAVLLAVPLFDLVLTRGPRWGRRMSALLAGPAFAVLLQVAFWARLWGPILAEARVPLAPGVGLELRLFEILLSSRHGIFTWTPLWFLATVGLALWAAREGGPMRLAFVGLILVVCANALMRDWWGLDAFGQRRALGLTVLFGLGLGRLFAMLVTRPFVPLAVLVLGLVLWNHQFAVIYNSQQAAGKGDPITLDLLAPAQVDLLYREWLAAEGRLPNWLFAVGYDNLKGIWLDEGRSLGGRIPLQGSQQLPFLWASGWLEPEDEEGATVRRSRGPASTLRVPIYTAGDFDLRLRARSLLNGPPLEVVLSVNGHRLGRGTASAEWTDLQYLVPASAVHRGLNTFVLEYDKTPRSLTGRRRGPDSAISLSGVSFERR